MLEELKRYRLLNGLSQQKLADLIGVPRGRYQQWENGNAKPKYEDTLLIENFLSKKINIITPDSTQIVKTNGKTTRKNHDEIDVSPAFKIRELAVCEGEGFTPPTDEEQRVIREHISRYHPNFYVLNLVIYHTGIRTNEALALRISDIDFVKRRFEIIPDSQRNNAKTRKNRLVPIVDELWQHIEAMALHKFPAQYYLFGSPAMSGRGHTGLSKIDKSSYFTPNPTRVKRDTATRLWKTIVKDGLGFSCDMYGLKHKGAQDKNDAGMSTDAVQQLFGHTSKKMTRRYQGELPHEREIREKSPAF